MNHVTLYRPRVLENVLSEFDGYIDSFFRNSFLNRSERVSNRLPSVDVREIDSAYMIEAELPGFEEKDIEIRVDGNTLTIESRKESEKKEEPAEKAGGGNYLIRERSLSSFSRSFKLPENTDQESITASFSNGILSMEIAKKPEAQKRVIQISKN